MEYLETIISLVFAPTAIVAGLAYVMRRLFDRSLDRDIAKFKHQLDSDLSATKAQLDQLVQTNIFEHQTKFSLYHSERASFIKELYAGIAELHRRIRMLIGIIYYDESMVDDLVSEDKRKEEAELIKRHEEVSLLFEKNVIYLGSELADHVRMVLGTLRTALGDFGRAMFRAEEQGNVEGEALGLWEEAAENIRVIVPSLMEKLESEFRDSLRASVGSERG